METSCILIIILHLIWTSFATFSQTITLNFDDLQTNIIPSNDFYSLINFSNFLTEEGSPSSQPITLTSLLRSIIKTVPTSTSNSNLEIPPILNASLIIPSSQQNYIFHKLPSLKSSQSTSLKFTKKSNSLSKFNFACSITIGPIDLSSVTGLLDDLITDKTDPDFTIVIPIGCDLNITSIITKNGFIKEVNLGKEVYTPKPALTLGLTGLIVTPSFMKESKTFGRMLESGDRPQEIKFDISNFRYGIIDTGTGIDGILNVIYGIFGVIPLPVLGFHLDDIILYT